MSRIEDDIAHDLITKTTNSFHPIHIQKQLDEEAAGKMATKCTVRAVYFVLMLIKLIDIWKFLENIANLANIPIEEIRGDNIHFAFETPGFATAVAHSKK